MTVEEAITLMRRFPCDAKIWNSATEYVNQSCENEIIVEVNPETKDSQPYGLKDPDCKLPWLKDVGEYYD